MISYLEDNFPDTEKEYYIIDRRQVVQLPELVSVHRILSYAEFLWNRKLIHSICTANKIVVSGVFTMQYILPIYGRDVLRKTYWQFWGGDYEQFRTNTRLSWKLGINKLLTASNLRLARGIILLTRQEINVFTEVFPITLNQRIFYAIVPPGAGDEDFISQVRMVGRKKTAQDIKRIVIGNSATSSNQHLEIFEHIKHMDLTRVELFCPLSYGEDEYRDRVVRRGKELFGDCFHPIVDYMKYEDYMCFLNTCDVGIYNNNRQQALGNINRLLDLGKKVFLPKRMREYCADYGYVTYAVETISYRSTKELFDFPEEVAEHNIGCAGKRTQDIYDSWHHIFGDAFYE